MEIHAKQKYICEAIHLRVCHTLHYNKLEVNNTTVNLCHIDYIKT